MDFLSKFDQSKIIGLLFLAFAALDKFVVLGFLLKNIERQELPPEKKDRTKRLLSSAINAGALLLALVGIALYSGIIDIKD